MYFYTALGHNYNFDFQTLEQLNWLLQLEGITKLFLVSDYRNQFYAQALGPQHEREPIAPVREIKRALRASADRRSSGFDPASRVRFLVSRHLQKQIDKISESALLAGRIAAGKLAVQGLLFDRENDTLLPIEPYLLVDRLICFN